MLASTLRPTYKNISFSGSTRVMARTRSSVGLDRIIVCPRRARSKDEGNTPGFNAAVRLKFPAAKTLPLPSRISTSLNEPTAL